MSLFENISDRQIKISAFSAVVVLAAIGLYFAGFNNAEPDSHKPAQATQVSRESLSDAMATLDQSTDLGNCRNALTQINLYLEHDPKDGPTVLSEADQKKLQTQFHLNEDETTEIAATHFTSLDAHHLDLCFLMRDAALRSLDVAGLPLLEQARAAFEWVVREIRLDDSDTQAAPVEYVVRRGSGSGEERALTFLTLLDQLKLHGCLIRMPIKPGDSVIYDRLAGVLVGGEIYLFDPQLGMPLPGPGGKGIATLAQLHKQPRMVEQMTVDQKHPYDVSASQAKAAEVRLVCSLSAMAPRMKYLEQLLATSAGVTLSSDVARLQKEFQMAAGAGVKVGFDEDQASDSDSLARLQSRFFPVAEGGTDKSHREDRFRLALFPLRMFPRLFYELPEDAPPGSLLRNQFAELFEDFPLEVQPLARQLNRQLSQEVGPGGQGRTIQGEDLDDWSRRLTFLCLTGAAYEMHGHHRYVYFTLAPDSPRDDMLRGRLEQAANRLGEALDQVEFQRRQARDIQQLQPQVEAWKQRMMEVYGRLNQLREAQAHGRLKDPKAFREAQAKMMMAWPILPVSRLLQVEGPMPAPPWMAILWRAAADPLGEQAQYLLALCAQEQAEHRQLQIDHTTGKIAEADRAAVREGWSAAAERWKTYLTAYPSSPAAGTARTLRARALEKLGNRQEAKDLLRDLSGLNTAEATAHLYQARRLGASKP